MVSKWTQVAATHQIKLIKLKPVEVASFHSILTPNQAPFADAQVLRRQVDESDSDVVSMRAHADHHEFAQAQKHKKAAFHLNEMEKLFKFKNSVKTQLETQLKFS